MHIIIHFCFNILMIINSNNGVKICTYGKMVGWQYVLDFIIYPTFCLSFKCVTSCWIVWSFRYGIASKSNFRRRKTDFNTPVITKPVKAVSRF